MRPGKLALVIGGAFAVLIGFVSALGGGALIWTHATQRDAAGYYTTSTERFTTSTYALTSNVDFGTHPGSHDWTLAHPVGTIRVRATAPGNTALFVGVAPQADVDAWLAGVAHEHVTRVHFGPFQESSDVVPGTATATAPATQRFWAASVTGTGTQTLVWPSEGGRWAMVVMNADAHRGVATDVSVGAKIGVLLPIGIGFATFGLLALGAGVMMILFGVRRPRGGALSSSDEASNRAETAPAAPASYPVRLDAQLDERHLSRWLWLVKWLLVIPHVVMLFFLWIAVFVLTVIAGFAILFTGRYPRAIFDFNVGVMRWTWRVSYYAVDAFGTDRYPPFSLDRDSSYPANLEIDYPEHLSRGLVLVKWWLLAIPQYLIVAVFAVGWGIGWNGAWRIAGSGGLIALLSIIAVLALAFSGRYPRPIFDFVMGMNRWCYRVLAYVALMRDEYPPFRLDNGGTDPGTVPAAPPPAPDRSGDLVAAR